jgi:hypothetical protein
MKVIHAENSLDLSEEPSQKPEISAAHPNEASLSLPERVARSEGQRRQASIVFQAILGLETRRADGTHVRTRYASRTAENERPASL